MVIILFWPAAIPRLFVQVIPFFIILLTNGIFYYFYETKDKKKISARMLYISSALLLIYMIGEYLLKLQFLGVKKEFFMTLVVLQVLLLVSLYFKNARLFLYFMLTSCVIWTYSTIYIHKSIFISVKNAAE